MESVSKIFNSRVATFLLLFVSLRHIRVSAQGTEGYFNGSSYVFLYNTLNIYGRTSFSFRTCSAGQLLYQEGVATDFIEVLLSAPGELRLRWSVSGQETSVSLGSNLINNRWHDVDLIQTLGTVTLTVDKVNLVIANSSYHKDLFDLQLERARPTIIVGRGFTGCILQGAGVVLNVSSLDSHEVSWGNCPLPDRGDCIGYDGDHCFSQPCHKYSKCISSPDNYHCECSTRYTGRNCDIDLGILCAKSEFNKCMNGGECQEDMMRNSTSCACLPVFTGVFCETTIENTFCDADPCRNGGTCNINKNQDNYVCTCPQGFAGVDCELNLDECLTLPCQNNGTCTDEINSYTCDCTGTGYRGPNCDININECEEGNPCYTGSACFDRYGDYICDCPQGFGGKNCDQEVNECNSNPCQNGGTCIDNLNNYLCHCIPGFAGINCETNIDDCSISSCPNNTHCVDGINTFSCVCNPGYTGAVPHCVEINECESIPCLNGGTCIDQLDNYLCTCLYGFRGRFCEININECISNPCKEGSTCIDGIGKYICSCVPGFTGVNCDMDINECDPNPCHNSYGCTNMLNNYSCACIPGWEGKNCDINIDECMSQPCLNGQCIDSNNAFSCSCHEGYSGRLCEENINECDSSPCLNSGFCTDLVADFSCQCAHDFMGKNCSQRYDACHSNPCQNDGMCSTTIPSRNFVCRCRPGYQGSQCEIDVNECAGVFCPHGQICYDLENRYECGCPIGFAGPTCQQNIDECSSSPCANGTCLDGIGTYTCICPSGFTGEHCESDVDECATNPCINGICKNLPGTFLCYCTPGYTGIMCNIEFNECLSSPCQNNATCNNLVNNYTCTCVPGFAGRDCEQNINECDSNPCQNGGTCTDRINNFECSCIPGFSGTSCEINIDECSSLPCLNGGLCVDQINSFECNCTDSGFSGLYCEANIDDCANNPCENGATCEDRVKDFYCHCHNGYEGKVCEIDVPECSSSPCLNSGLCLENSNKTLYEMNYLGFFSNFSYYSAGGYRCVCSSGFQGINCETNIDDCEVNACSSHGECIDGINDYYCACLPGFEGLYCTDEINECEVLPLCQNGATCQDLVADYVCHCPEGFGDKNCGTELIGCRDNRCENNAVCKPFLSQNGMHNYTCICPQGYHGPHCESITTASFVGNGSWILDQPISFDKYDISLFFRTTLPDGILAHGIVTRTQLEYLLYLEDGHLSLVVYGNGSQIVELVSPPKQNDGEWRKVHITFENALIALNTSGMTYIKSLTPPATELNFDTLLGAQRSMLMPHPDFIGCIQDIYVNEEIAIPDHFSTVMENVEIGCPRTDQCITSPCVQGKCKDNWTSYECVCSRPYFGRHCEFSHFPATFGYKNTTSSAELSIPVMKQPDLTNSIDVTFLLRTRKQDGLLFYLGNSPADHFMNTVPGLPSTSFMLAQLSNGKLHVSLKSSIANPIEVTLDKKLDNGEYHLIQVSKDNNKVTLRANETTETKMIPNGPIISQVLYIGGFSANQRHRRQADSSYLSNGLVSYSFDNITNFKGIIQDFRINDKVVVFYPLNEGVMYPSDNIPEEMGLATMIGAMKGVLSDDLCQPINPCSRAAACNDIWNEYTCECPKGYRGKTCAEEEPCNHNSCPEKSECVNLDVGYECVAPVSLNGKNNSMRYKVQNIEPSVSNISFSFRSKNDGTILWLGNVNTFMPSKYFLQVELLNGSSSLEVKWDFGSPLAAIKTISKELENDGDWYDVQIVFKDSVVQLYVSARSDTRETVPQLSEDNYLKPLGVVLSNNSSIILGGSPDVESLFKGCLDNVRIGGILVPFFQNAVLPLSQNPFVTDFSNTDIGCVLCWRDDCINGMCEDAATKYSCNCLGGYEGDFCSIDMCISQNPCVNDGQCYHHENMIMCQCTSLFTGPNCTIEDKCASSPCLNNGFCNHNLITDDYECSCRDAYEGKNCEKKKIIDCSSNPCTHGYCKDDNISSSIKYFCQCFDGYEGENCDKVQDLCLSVPCGANGNCSIMETPTYASYQCHCNYGYTGRHCETDINECDTNPCGNGDCVDSVGSYTCICYPGYQGTTCDDKISSCYSADQVCFNGSCKDTENGYECVCNEGFFGRHCNVPDECDSSKCSERGMCSPMHDLTERFFLFNCTCKEGYAGTSCTERLSISGSDDDDDASLILMILIPVMTVFILCLLIGAIVFLRIAKKKRATRGTYSPSRQEMFGSRVEMNHVMKPPPEERLI